jgi:phosphopantothenate-cysteine ligase/phosphopantothenoylcysteine decarboxylase/phosphopantothenate--cysteine ligase
VKILITGGNTFVPIDKVRGITNIFRGSTAVAIANQAVKDGHEVVLLGNRHMEAKLGYLVYKGSKMEFSIYRTYDELYEAMQERVNYGDFDVVIHSAAVSDYKVSRVLGPAMLDSSIPTGGKISSSYERLYLELTPTEKIVDKIRNEWEFEGVLVKFKLQVDMSDGELLRIAERSRLASRADLMVANCLEWAKERAFILGRSLDILGRSLDQAEVCKCMIQIPDTDKYALPITRDNLPVILLAHIQSLFP